MSHVLSEIKCNIPKPSYVLHDGSNTTPMIKEFQDQTTMTCINGYVIVGTATDTTYTATCQANGTYDDDRACESKNLQFRMIHLKKMIWNPGSFSTRLWMALKRCWLSSVSVISGTDTDTTYTATCLANGVSDDNWACTSKNQQFRKLISIAMVKAWCL